MPQGLQAWRNDMDLRDVNYVDGELETNKFAGRRDAYYQGLDTMKNLGYETEDYIHHFPCFVGHLTLSRFLSLHEIYQKTLGVAGHIADVGVYRGASMLFFSKLAQIYEPTTLTQVHGFDWFQGNVPGEMDPDVLLGSSTESYERVMKLVEANSLENITKVHKLDLTKDLDKFFKQYPHLQFRLIFLDTGTYDVVKACLPYFWERLTTGGVLILDTYNVEIAPGETKAVRDFFDDKGCEIKTFPRGWIPTAYIEK